MRGACENGHIDEESKRLSSNTSVYHCSDDLAVLERQDLVAQEYASSMALLSGLRKVCFLRPSSSLICCARITDIRFNS